jgi:hypothetical protein
MSLDPSIKSGSFNKTPLGVARIVLFPLNRLVAYITGVYKKSNVLNLERWI